MAKKIPAAVTKELGWYVYLYVDPRTDEVFYVGKGQRQRAVKHLKSTKEKPLTNAIKALQKQGVEPRIEILAHGLPDEATALRIEAAAIDLLGVQKLANQVHGWGEKKPRRMPLDELVSHYHHKKAAIKEPSILIRVNRFFRYGISAAELYDATRSGWRVSKKRREQVELAFAVYKGVIREVYRVQAWHPLGSTFVARRKGRAQEPKHRSEFVGVIAEDEVRDRYLNRYVGHAFTPGDRNPIHYLNID